jgi:hypothetical protein
VKGWYTIFRVRIPFTVTGKKTDKQVEIEDLEKKKAEIIEKKKTADKKISFSQLDKNQIFNTSLNERKFFPDTIKIVACRAETAMANLIKGQMSSPEQARSLIRKFYVGCRHSCR